MFDLDVSKQMNYVPWAHSPVTKAINLVEGSSKVLDVGCSYGYVGKELKKKECRMFGIEIDPDTAKIAQKEYEKVAIMDISEVEALPFEEGFFDYILYLDVLEHVIRPDIVLRKFKRYLKKTGIIIVSLPNIGRLEYRLQLLFGRFEYSNTGILSKGHVRFFNYKNAKKLIEEAGFEIFRIDYTGLASMIRVFPKLISFQFLISAKQRRKLIDEDTVNLSTTYIT